jgi:hypothetical protein
MRSHEKTGINKHKKIPIRTKKIIDLFPYNRYKCRQEQTNTKNPPSFPKLNVAGSTPVTR